MSDEEELSLEILPLETTSTPQPEKSNAQQPQPFYDGPERRSGKERRSGQDRREMLRFEPEKDRPDRRDGKDRRRGNRKKNDLWDKRDF